MTLSEKLTAARPAPIRQADNQSAPSPTAQQRRLLRLLLQGDLIWERADDSGYRTIYDEKRGCDRRLPTVAVTALEQQGWIQRRPNPQVDRLDSWELTPSGRALAALPPSRPVPKAPAALLGMSASQEAKDRSPSFHH